MTAQAEVAQKAHGQAVRFFWILLFGATAISLVGNVAHAVLPYISRVVIQVGAAAVPPIVLLAAVHGIALAVRAGASSRIYHWAVAAVALIGLGAFAVSFVALRDLMHTIGYGQAIAWIFPAIIDTTVGVSTLMLVALGDKPARRSGTTKASLITQTSRAKIAATTPTQSAKTQVESSSPAGRPVRNAGVRRSRSSLPVQPDVALPVKSPAPSTAQVDDDAALVLIASGVTTQPLETVISVLSAYREGASINASARAAGINYRTAQRIVVGAGELRRTDYAAAS